MPLIEFRPLSRSRRRLSNAWCMVSMAAFAAVLFCIAASAPYCAKLVALEVVWL